MLAPGFKPNKFYLTDDFKNKLKQTSVAWKFGGLSAFTYYRTYARKKDNGGLETWAECVIRVTEGSFTILKSHAASSFIPWDEDKGQQLAEEFALGIFNFKWTPPGRGLWMMGTDFIYEKGGAALNNCAFISTENLHVEFSRPFAFLMDMSMLGVGVGFDTKGADSLVLLEPLGTSELVIVEDSREGWVEAIACLIDSYMEPASRPIEIDTSLVRAYGESIKGFGGVASGPEPLIQGFNGIRDILSKRANSDDNRIKSTDIVDIMNLIGKIVVAGNVRRTAELSLASVEDNNFIEMKNYNKFPVEVGIKAPDELKLLSEKDYDDYNNNFDSRSIIAKRYSNYEWAYKFGGWRWASNNSLFAKVGMNYSKIAKSIAVNGEPGLIWLDTMRAYSRLKELPDYKDKKAQGTNPCITADTFVLTTEGQKQVKNLINKSFYAIVNDKIEFSKGFWSTGIKNIVKITLDNGLTLKVTPDHKLLTKNNKWIETKYLLNQEVMINNSLCNTWDNDIGSHIEGYIIGHIIGDGTFFKNNKNIDVPVLTFWVEKTKNWLEHEPIKLLQTYFKTLPLRSDFNGFNIARETENYIEVRAKTPYLSKICEKYNLFRNEKSVYEIGSREFTKGLIQGIFDADGSVQGDQKKGVSIRLTQTKLDRLESMQRLLLNFNIVSKLYKNRKEKGFRKLPNGTGGYSDYMCEAIHELTISNDSLIKFYNLIGFINEDKQNKLKDIISNYKRTPNKSKFYSKIISIEKIEDEEVFDCSVDNINCFSANGIIAHNCSEQTLESYELCCLVESYPSNHKDYYEFQRTLKFAYLYAKIVTLVATHWPETNAVITRNRRIGCSQSGILEAMAKFGRRNYLDDFCDKAYDYIQYVDKKYSEWMGIPRSIKTTSVKPSGCQPKDTLILTSDGLKYLEELGDITGTTWQNIENISTDENKKISKFYINGKQKTYKLYLESGFILEATENHKYKIWESKDLIWKDVKNIKIGDIVPYTINNYPIKNITYQTLLKSPKPYWNVREMNQPDFIDEDLAWFLGLYIGDGSNHKKGIRIASNINELDILEKAKSIIQNKFNITGIIYLRTKGENNADLYINSTWFNAWLKINKLDKNFSKDISIPSIIRNSPKSVIEAYLEGYYCADGCEYKENYKLYTTISKKMAIEIATLIRALGDSSSIKTMKPTETSWGTNDRYMVYQLKGWKGEYQKTQLSRYFTELKNANLTNLVPDKIIKIEESENDTYDIEVLDKHRYSVNGYISHNTVSLVSGALPGIHGAESTAYYRTVRLSTISDLIPLLKQANYRIEPAASDPIRTSVVYFPVLLADNVPCIKDLSIWEQFQNAADMQKYWADNQVSITVTFKQNEINQIARVLECYDNQLKSVSLLPLSEHGYEQAPYIEAPREEVKKYMDSLLPIDFSVLTKEGDNSEANKFCDSTGCEI